MLDIYSLVFLTQVIKHLFQLYYYEHFVEKINPLYSNQSYNKYLLNKQIPKQSNIKEMKDMFKSVKSFFSSQSKPQANSSTSGKNNTSITKPQMVPRIVNFGGKQEYNKNGKNQQSVYNDANGDGKDHRYQNLPKFPSLKDFGLKKDQFLQGETVILYQPKSILCKMSNGKYEQIRLMATDYRLYIAPQKKNIESFQLSKIQRLNKYTNNENFYKIFIGLKDGRNFKFRVNFDAVWKRFYAQIDKFAFVKDKKMFFAFKYFQVNKSLQDYHQGWKLYNPIRQFKRMGISISDGLNNQNDDSQYKILDNKNGKVCDTYPEILLVPSGIPNDSLLRCSKFRSRNRMPALTYAYQYQKNKFSSLYRSSQSKTGVQNSRSRDDQAILRIIGDPKITYKQLQTVPHIGQANCVIYDARGYMAALGNKISGKGYESTQYYVNCRVQFLNIPNIHVVRQSYNKVIKAAFGEDSKFFSNLAESQWYDFVFLILSGSLQIANNLKKGINILIHCSDGWDRTAQLSSISGILLDKYYRTIQGFEVLIQKDWIHFGHQFSTRLGQGMNNPTSQQRSQIFLQFLDCVSQLLFQFPSQFEFNYKFLEQIAVHSYSNLFGNFLSNCELQMYKYNVQSQTVSLWSHIASQRQRFLNPYYMPIQNFLQVSVAQKHMRFFKELFLSNLQSFKDIYDIYSCKFTQDNLQIMYQQLKKQKQLLQQKLQENEMILNGLNEQISKNQSHQ